jgi:hypothetical protein
MAWIYYSSFGPFGIPKMVGKIIKSKQCLAFLTNPKKYGMLEGISVTGRNGHQRYIPSEPNTSQNLPGL